MSFGIQPVYQEEEIIVSLLNWLKTKGLNIKECFKNSKVWSPVDGYEIRFSRNEQNWFLITVFFPASSRYENQEEEFQYRTSSKQHPARMVGDNRLTIEKSILDQFDMAIKVKEVKDLEGLLARNNNESMLKNGLVKI